MKQKIIRILFYTTGVLLVLLIWWFITSSPNSALHRFNVFDTFKALMAQFENKNMYSGMKETLQRLLLGLVIAAVLGIPIGLLTGFFIRVHEITYIPFQFLRMISPLSWTPVAIILLGVGSGPVYFLIAIAAIWPIIINTAAGVNASDKQWIEVARCLGARNKEIFRYILLRAALPSILTGVQLALGVAWIVIVPAEMLGVGSGLGYMILDFRDTNDYASIMAIILIIGMLGLLTDIPLRLAIKKASWNNK